MSTSQKIDKLSSSASSLLERFTKLAKENPDLVEAGLNILSRTSKSDRMDSKYSGIVDGEEDAMDVQFVSDDPLYLLWRAIQNRDGQELHNQLQLLPVGQREWFNREVLTHAGFISAANRLRLDPSRMHVRGMNPVNSYLSRMNPNERNRFDTSALLGYALRRGIIVEVPEHERIQAASDAIRNADRTAYQTAITALSEEEWQLYRQILIEEYALNEPIPELDALQHHGRSPQEREAIESEFRERMQALDRPIQQGMGTHIFGARPVAALPAASSDVEMEDAFSGLSRWERKAQEKAARQQMYQNSDYWNYNAFSGLSRWERKAQEKAARQKMYQNSDYWNYNAFSGLSRWERKAQEKAARQQMYQNSEHWNYNAFKQ
jgi:hypothetical protein